jgi:hypothetical protein
MSDGCTMVPRDVHDHIFDFFAIDSLVASRGVARSDQGERLTSAYPAAVDPMASLDCITWSED